MIRCVKTQPPYQTRELSESVVNNRHFMRKYKWKREDLAEPVVPIAVVEEANKSIPNNVPIMEGIDIPGPEFPDIPAPEFIDTEESEKDETTTTVTPPKARVLPKAPRKPRKTTKK